MAYRISDLIEKLITIEESAEQLYSSIEKFYKESNPAVSMVAKTLAKEEKRHILYYKAVKRDVEKKNNEEIDFFLYDKAVKQLYEFGKYLQIPKLNNVRDLVMFAVEFEKNNVGLLLDIQGKLVEKLEDVNNEVYEVLTRIIKEEQKHEKTLEQFI